jgi:excisionase family DNA binding protein
MPGIERLLTVGQVADWLQLKPRTIYQWVHEGYIPVIKVGALVRFKPGSIRDWISKREAMGRTQRRIELDLN